MSRPSGRPIVNLHCLDRFSLSLFSLVARTGSISKGAELASLAVGATTKRITDLEAAVGTALLERHSRGVNLTTPAGCCNATLPAGDRS